MTLGRIAEVLDEIEADAERDFTPNTLRYIRDTLDEVRRRLGLDTSERD